MKTAADDTDIYNVYTLNLPNTIFALLATSPTDGHLTLQGPVETPGLFGGTFTEPSNGAALIFSTLTIDHSAAVITPEPSTYALFVLGLGGLATLRRRK